jgi:hypothetical protein
LLDIYYDRTKLSGFQSENDINIQRM